MEGRGGLVDDELLAYVQGVSSREPDVLARLRAATASLPGALMQIGPDQGQLLALLARLVGARRCIEVGTYTGYSALALALALPDDGELVACDVSEESVAVGRPFWREAGVEGRIRARIQPALATLDELLAAPGGRGGYDLAFVDADKPAYVDYYERLLLLVRRGGLIVVDNTLALGGTPVYRLDSAGARAVEAFSAHVHGDERVDLALLSVGEGVTLLRVR